MEGRQRGRVQAGSSQGCERDSGTPGRAGPGREPTLVSRPQEQQQGATRRPGHLCETAQLAVFTDIGRFQCGPSHGAEDSGSAPRLPTLTHSRWPDWALAGPQPLAT